MNIRYATTVLLNCSVQLHYPAADAQLPYSAGLLMHLIRAPI